MHSDGPLGGSGSRGLTHGHLDLGAGQVGSLRVGVLGVVVGDSGLDGVLSEHGAVNWGTISYHTTRD